MAGELPTGDYAVFAFLEMIALAFAFASVEALVASRPWYISVGCLVLAILFFLAGIKWPQIKLKIGAGFISTVNVIVRNPLYRWSLFLLLIGSIGVLAVSIFRYAVYPRNRTTILSPVKDDEVSHIEALLGDVQESAYRQLVAAVIHSFEPKATLSVGILVATPDGTRKIDVEVRSPDNSRLTAVDIVNLPIGQKAGVEVVDAADSKMADIKATAILVCSNTGFDAIAIAKAKRKKIGLISVLRQGDKRVKAVIEEEMYLRKIDITPLTITYNGEVLQNLKSNEITYNGVPVDAWLQLKASQVAAMNPDLTFGITDTFNLKEPTVFYRQDRRVTLTSIAVSFQPKVQWLSQIVQFDAKTGIYDYVRGRVLVAAGDNSYTVSGIDFDHAKPLSGPPPANDLLGVGLKPGEVAVALALVHGAPEKGIDIANLDDLIRPEDLNLKIPPKDIEQLRRK
jgi:hypothetical protein